MEVKNNSLSNWICIAKPRSTLTACEFVRGRAFIFPNCVVLCFPTGWPGPQVRLHHFLPRRPAQEQSQEDLWGVNDILTFVQDYQLFWANSSISACLPIFRFRATLYPCPETPPERKEMLAGVHARIEDLQMVSRLEVKNTNALLTFSQWRSQNTWTS